MGMNELISSLNSIVRALGQLITSVNNSLPNYSARGSLTLTAGTTTSVANTAVLPASQLWLQPTNASGAALTTQPYVSAQTAGTGFTLTHASAAGTETFQYLFIR
jgi:hypothetical protein